MKYLLLLIGAGSFFIGLKLRLNAKEYGKVLSNVNNTWQIEFVPERVTLADQTGFVLIIFGLLVCLLVFHHLLQREVK